MNDLKIHPPASPTPPLCSPDRVVCDRHSSVRAVLTSSGMVKDTASQGGLQQESRIWRRKEGNRILFPLTTRAMQKGWRRQQSRPHVSE